MVPPQARFYLRLDTGERAGEEVPIPADGLTVGRRPENALQLAESSISGRHASLAVESGGVTLRDLGSTNGTRVGEQRVEEHRLAHGDVVTFGNLRCLFVDSSMDAPSAAAPAPGAAPGVVAADVGDGVTTVTDDRVAKTARKGIWTLVLVLVLLAGAAGAALRILGSGDDPASSGAPVPEVEGNLLADGSFESESPLAWEDADAAPVAFYRDGSFRSTGANGLGADLAAGEWARVRSPEFTLRQRRSTTLRAELGVEGSARACIGVELLSDEPGRPPFVAWSDPVTDLASVELTLDGLPGYGTGRILVEGRSEGGDGSVLLDDVSVVEGSAGAGAAATFEEYGLHLFAPASRSGALLRAGTVLLGGIRVREARTDGLPRWPAARLVARAAEKGIAVTVEGAPAACELVLAVSDEAGGDADLGWLATTGPDGFRAHSGAFEDVPATGMLLGQGVDLIRIGFPEPVRASALRTEQGVRLVFASQAGLAGFELQLAFGQERGEARTLAASAADLERRGDSGAALEAWSDLLDRYPFDAALVEEASSARARLLSMGHDRIHAVRQELERARFFDLGDLYRECRARAAEIGASFGDSEVAQAAADLVAEIDAELGSFDQARGAARESRLRAVLSIVEDKEWGGVAGRLRAALEEGSTPNPSGNR